MCVALLALLFSASLFADGEWWTIPRSEDEKNFYYVGVSEGKEGIAGLQDKAFNKAMGELIREHFGMSIQINERSVEELHKQQFHVVTKQSSAPLFIKGVGIVKTRERDLDEEGFRVYVQIQADKQNVAAAVKAQTTTPGNDSLNTFGESHDSKVDLTVKTHPQGALIFFTSLDRHFTLQGQGDARFYLPRGRYQMVVSHPGFATEKRELELRSQGLEESIILEELNGAVDLDAFPDDALIVFEGQKIKAGVHKLPVEKIHRFVISHPDYFTQEVEFVIEHPETISKSIRLEPKPSTLQYEVYPATATVSVNGQQVTRHRNKIALEPGKKTISISAPGYFPHEESVLVGTNRIYPLKVVKLKVDDNTMSPTDRGLAYRFEFNPFTNYGKVGYGLVGLAAHAEYHYISIGGGAGLSQYKDKDDEDETTSVSEQEEKSLNDNYATVRLITPKLGTFKFFASGTVGQYKRSRADSFGKTVWKEKKDYTGLGGGLRGYISPRWSVHAEYFRLNVTQDEKKFKTKEDRLILGVGYEF